MKPNPYFFLLVSQVILKLRSVLVIPILTKALGASTLGIYSTLIATIWLLTSLSHLGFEDSISRYLNDSVSDRTIARQYYGLLVLVLGVSAVLSICVFLTAGHFSSLVFNGSQAYLIKITSVLFLFWSLETLHLHFFRAQQKMLTFAIFQMTKSVLDILILATILVVGFGLSEVLYGFTVVRIGLFTITSFRIGQIFKIRRPSFSDVYTHLSFGIPVAGSHVSNWVFRLSDRFLIGLFLSTEGIGVFSSVYGMGFYSIQLFLAPISISLLPRLSSLLNNDELMVFEEKYRISYKYFLSFSIPAFVGVSMYSRELLVLFTTPRIARIGHDIVPIVALASMFYGVFIISSVSFKLFEDTRLESALWFVGAVLNFVLNVLLIPRFGIIAAAVSTLISSIVLALWTIQYVKREIGVLIDVKHTVKCVGSVLPIVILHQVTTVSNVFELGGIIALSSTGYFVTLFLLGGTRYESFKAPDLRE